MLKENATCSPTGKGQELQVLRAEVVKAMDRLRIDVAIARSLVIHGQTLMTECEEQLSGCNGMLESIDDSLRCIGMDIAEDDVAW